MRVPRPDAAATGEVIESCRLEPHGLASRKRVTFVPNRLNQAPRLTSRDRSAAVVVTARAHREGVRRIRGIRQTSVLIPLALFALTACEPGVGYYPSEDDRATGGQGGSNAFADARVLGRSSGYAGSGGGYQSDCRPGDENCECINIGIIGRLPTYGAVPGQDNTSAFEAWLNEKSTAKVEIFTSYNALTPEFLDQFDVIILQALEDREGGPYWNYTADDIANLRSWVSDGGGVISLTGYGSQPAEIDPTNRLLSFTSMSYNPDDVVYTCPDNCCYCVGNSVPISGWNSAHPIALHMTAVGAFHGRSIDVGKDGEVVAAQDGKVLGATIQIDRGRVFMFADEWVSYTSQWTGEGVSGDCNSDPNHSCYGTSAESTYQVPQFWYNAILWVSGDRPCFIIEEPTIII
ncbi:MAG: hypothetical protein JXA30_18280 [Deltaproteobacteria bacterium]|nr:hypothetical protein [Deltaproteobacteria bacterium]